AGLRRAIPCQVADAAADDGGRGRRSGGLSRQRRVVVRHREQPPGRRRLDRVVAQRGALAGRLALYTTIHPGSLRFAAEWYRSTVAQTDRAVDLWISVDGLEVEAVVGAVGERPVAVWRAPPPGSSKAEVRSAVLEELTAAYPAVILVDSDDVLLPGRVQAARQALAESDVTG